jgi:hypothetical protein
MKHSTLLVTLAIGDSYLQAWRTLCEPNWARYAAAHGYDLLCIDTPLDNCERARRRSPSWQKCLILGQEFANRYERVVWVDADILINAALSPSITEGVPVEKVGAVQVKTPARRELYIEAVRTYRCLGLKAFKAAGESASDERLQTAQEYYENWGLSGQLLDGVVQAGVLVLSPRYHRELLEHVYYRYEDKGEYHWNYEMRPLSYELLKADKVHWIDRRFNQGWPNYRLLHYPFLVGDQAENGIVERVMRRVRKPFGTRAPTPLMKVCATAAFVNSYFLHFAGSVADMTLVDPCATSWTDRRL